MGVRCGRMGEGRRPGNFFAAEKRLMQEFNSLGLKSLHVDELYYLSGFCVNLEHRLPNRASVKLPEDSKVYLGSQTELPEGGWCYGIVGDAEHPLVCEYGPDGFGPEVVLGRKRNSDEGEF